MPTTIQIVDSSDTPNQGRTKWNTNDTNLKATADALEAQQAAHVGEGHPSLYYTKTEIDTQQAAQDAALTAHKTSGDHDTRYALLSALLDMVKLTTDQIIDGIKTFLKTIIIKSDTAAIELQKGDGTPKGRFSYDSNSDAISLDVRQQGSWQSLLRTSPNASHVNFPNHEVRSKGKTLATEEYVQARVKSGNFSIGSISIYLANILFGTYNFIDATTKPITVVPPRNSKLRSISLAWSEDTNSMTNWGKIEFLVSYSFPDTSTSPIVLIPKLILGAEGGADLTMRLKLDVGDYSAVQTEIFNEIATEWQGPPSSLYVTITLNFSL